MATQKTSNRRRITDLIVFMLVGLCVVLIAVYQVQGVANYVVDQPEPVPTLTRQPSGGFVPPTREPEDFVGTLIFPTQESLTPETTAEAPGEDD